MLISFILISEKWRNTNIMDFDLNKISLLIQGPIKSRGVSFQSGIKNDYNSYDYFHAYERILKNIIEFRKISNNIVLSTYIGELNSEELYALKNLNVSVIQDVKNGPISIGDSQVNTINQFVSTLKGLNQLRNDGFEGYVIKIRTDVTLDFVSLVKDIVRLVKFNKNIFIIPYFINRKKIISQVRIDYFKKIFNNYVLYMLDFIFIAEMNNLIDIISAGIYNKISIDGHRFLITSNNYIRGHKASIAYWESMVLKTKTWPITSLLNLLLYINLFLHERKFNNLLYNYFYPLTLKTVDSICWRNSKYIHWNNINKYNYEFLVDSDE